MGANQAPSNVNNLTAVLFLWTILPGYAAASYMPTIVLERPLFVRCNSPNGLLRKNSPDPIICAHMLEFVPHSEGAPLPCQCIRPGDIVSRAQQCRGCAAWTVLLVLATS